mgnify:CR=1 FL=1
MIPYNFVISSNNELYITFVPHVKIFLDKNSPGLEGVNPISPGEILPSPVFHLR